MRCSGRDHLKPHGPGRLTEPVVVGENRGGIESYGLVSPPTLKGCLVANDAGDTDKVPMEPESQRAFVDLTLPLPAPHYRVHTHLALAPARVTQTFVKLLQHNPANYAMTSESYKLYLRRRQRSANPY